ncbi:DUF4358 domain-containing protein [Erysipelotrichaceae bacterium RD49]|nr:DUF4358 domain-containing protein [Erysipelotrichaceae bacterium RD49]
MPSKFKNPYAYGQAILLVILVLFLISSFFQGSIHSTASFAQVESAVLAAVDQNQYPKQDNLKIRRLFSLDPYLAKNIGLYRISNGMEGSEMVLVEYDPSQKDQIEQAMKDRQSLQKSIYEGYAPDQAELVDGAVIDFQDNYGLYYVGADPQKVDQAFRQAIKGN